jgi:hypothetical protein
MNHEIVFFRRKSEYFVSKSQYFLYFLYYLSIASFQSALFWCARGGESGTPIEGEMHLRCTKYLLSTVPRNHLREFLGLHTGANLTALIAAAAEGRSSTVRTLIEAGADLNAKDIRGQGALQWAQQNGHDKVVVLIESFSGGSARWHRRDQGGANWDTGNHVDELCVAAMEGNVDKIKNLVRNGADISEQLKAWKPGSSALYLAARGGVEGGPSEGEGHVECVR